MSGAEALEITVRQLRNVKDTVNSLLPYQPVILVGGTAIAVHGIHCIIARIPNDGALAGLQRLLFRNLRKIPAVKRKVDEEVKKAEKVMKHDIKTLYQGDNSECIFITDLPSAGLSTQDILEKIKDYSKLGSYKWGDGAVSGTVYHGGEDLTQLNTEVYRLCAWTNPLHPDVFPGVCKMEAEIVRIGAALFHGGPTCCGTMTSGGTESIILAVKAYRDWAMTERGILYPEIIVPVTGHAAFDKAAHILNLRIKHVPIDEDTCTVNVKKMKSMITRSTIMLVGSAPAFPHGCIDDIQSIAALGRKYNIPVHVDACLGGFLLAFMPAAGHPIPPFDFNVPGVTSISADTHKYGYAPKGSSLLMFSEKKFKEYQHFTQADWPGGLYASPTIAGSRPGVLIAGCWASLLHFGYKGYVDATKKIIDTARQIEKELRKIDGISVMGRPQVSVIALTSKVFDIYRLQGGLGKKGWSLNALQFPPSIHFCLTYCQTAPGVAERFVKDVKELTAEIMKNPGAPSSGAVRINRIRIRRVICKLQSLLKTP
ncbi:unnamed protein product [Orchesella dallaii]|uniref:sphinganine-1-phosphate aldolase n=1 Tax=Orchesella dallaii TaxID=48710 RepID=A0ABP1QL87_9HEXA